MHPVVQYLSSLTRPVLTIQLWRSLVCSWFDNPSLKSIVGLPDVSADTLVAVLGIDPKVADVLADNGIKTLFDLASTSPKLLQFIITRSGFDSPKVPTDAWPRQAQYIVENRLDDLKQYRATLNS